MPQQQEKKIHARNLSAQKGHDYKLSSLPNPHLKMRPHTYLQMSKASKNY